jgi:DNA helicase-2/ATP-dependent DNA helicase PcrA
MVGNVSNEVLSLEIAAIKALAVKEKQRIIDHDDGPAIVSAGPGCGKTTTLADKLISLCKMYDPARIFALTFTNLAAEEMRAKVLGQCTEAGEDIPEPHISTLHSLAKGILHQYHEVLHLPAGFSVIDDADWLIILEDIRIELKNSTKNLGNSHNTYRKHSQAARALETGEYFQLPPIPGKEGYATQEQFNDCYESLLRYYGCVDWYDVVWLAVGLFQEHQDILDLVTRNIDFLLIDEYQDLNEADQLLIRLLSADVKSLVVFGDDDQSIYETARYANPTGMKRFSDIFTDAEIYELSICWRCGETILDNAWNLVNVDASKLPERMTKSKPVPSPERGTGEVHYKKFKSEKAEIEEIFGVLDHLSKDGAPRTVLVLFHSKTLGQKYSEKLREMGLQFKDLLKQEVPSDVIDLLIQVLILVTNRGDNLAARHILKALFEINADVIARLRQVSIVENCGLWDAAISNQETRTQLSELDGKIVEWRDIESPVEVLRAACTFLGWDEKDGIQELIGTCESIDPISLRSMITAVGRREKDDEPAPVPPELDSGAKIILMTMHGAKGLGGDIVLIPALDDELIPNGWYEPEQRRLLYVSMTRAKEVLLMSSAWSRTGRVSYRSDARAETDRARSRFINEIGL